MPHKLGHEKFYVHEEILRTQNCHRKFIKSLLPEKRKGRRKPNNRDLNHDWTRYCRGRNLTILIHKMCK